MQGIESDNQTSARESYLEELVAQFRANGWKDDENLGVTISLINEKAEQVAEDLRDGVIDPALGADPTGLHVHLLEEDSYVVGVGLGEHVVDLAIKYLQIQEQ